MLGKGRKFNSATPGAYSLFAGITLPANGVPLAAGSLITNEFPLLSTLCEKSPFLSRVVGRVALRAVLGRNWRWNSWLQKKNSLSLVRSLGISTGPPMV